MADKMTNATVKLFLDGREIKNSVADIEKEMKKLRKTQRDLVIGSEEYNRTGKQIQELNGILATHRASIRNTGKEYLTLSQRLGKVADGFNRYMGVVAHWHDSRRGGASERGLQADGHPHLARAAERTRW